ncbi:hypothetical protein PENSUB_140 [Penicillium subrubescens]|uniref:Uncharacterized protein n=1 Tax=Penicillium subrubescens TaxID=1316194 RepID=A0A1Q5UNV6_9EURO|nr:hypothetical protein PENSUB_140 [Penicillium subrubescens]
MQSPQLGHALRSKTAMVCAQKPLVPGNPKQRMTVTTIGIHAIDQGRTSWEVRPQDAKILLQGVADPPEVKPHPNVDLWRMTAGGPGFFVLSITSHNLAIQLPRVISLTSSPSWFETARPSAVPPPGKTPQYHKGEDHRHHV